MADRYALSVAEVDKVMSSLTTGLTASEQADKLYLMKKALDKEMAYAELRSQVARIDDLIAGDKNGEHAQLLSANVAVLLQQVRASLAAYVDPTEQL